MKDLSSVKILGDSTLIGGKYNKVQILGNVSTTGDIECNILSVMGELIKNGRLKCSSFKLMGEAVLKCVSEIDVLNIWGSMKAEEKIIISSELKVRGELNANNSIELRNGEILGKVINDKELIFDKIKILGELENKGDCQGNEFSSKGILKIYGLLSADKIEIFPKYNSFINEIGGSEISIRRTKVGEKMRGRVKSNLIEGDKIILENTDCDIVRGHDVTILNNCDLKLIEYTGKLTVNENSKVGEKVCLKN